MTLDDQLSALSPLDSSGGGVIARLAEYRDGPVQLRKYRLRGARMPGERLRTIARNLRRLADVAEEMAER